MKKTLYYKSRKQTVISESKGSDLIRGFVKFLIDLYRIIISPILPPSCRFHPSCSEYAKDAFTSHGFFAAFLLTLRRILRCHPYNAGGYDPVPLRSIEKACSNLDQYGKKGILK